MATIISLKRRIDAARNVSKTTKAMQMISASKLKRAQNTAVSTRPYVKHLGILTNNVIEKLNVAKGKIKVMISIFGRATPVELETWQVEKV